MRISRSSDLRTALSSSTMVIKEGLDVASVVAMRHETVGIEYRPKHLHDCSPADESLSDAHEYMIRDRYDFRSGVTASVNGTSSFSKLGDLNASGSWCQNTLYLTRLTRLDWKRTSHVAAYLVAVEVTSSVVVEKGVPSSHKHDTTNKYLSILRPTSTRPSLR
jgi:hypothetical protein